jgi:hypothetical protein
VHERHTLQLKGTLLGCQLVLTLLHCLSRERQA